MATSDSIETDLVFSRVELSLVAMIVDLAEMVVRIELVADVRLAVCFTTDDDVDVFGTFFDAVGLATQPGNDAAGLLSAMVDEAEGAVAPIPTEFVVKGGEGAVAVFFVHVLFPAMAGAFDGSEGLE